MNGFVIRRLAAVRQLSHSTLLVSIVWLGSGVADYLLAQEKSVQESTDDERVRAIAASYLANRESFSQIVCEYELRQSAPSNEDELFYDRAVPQAIAAGLMVRSGGTTRCEINLDDAAIAEAVRLSRVVFVPQRFLIRGQDGIAFSKLVSGAVLYSSAALPEEYPLTPFDLGRFSESRREFTPGMILQRSELSIAAKIIDAEPPNEPHVAPHTANLVGLEYSFAGSGRAYKWIYWVDVLRGCVPLINRSYVNGKPMQKSVITDVRTFEGGATYPIRSINFMFYNDEQTIAWAVDTRVKSLRVGGPIDEALLQIDIDAGTLLRDTADDMSQVRLPKERSVGISDLDELFALTAAQSKQEQLWATARSENEGERSTDSRSNWRPIVVICNALLALTICAWAMLRKKLRKT